jgi:hypothetical protein
MVTLNQSLGYIAREKMKDVTEKNVARAKLIADRMKRAAKVKTYGELGKILGGITSQAISSAIAKEKIPDHWFDIIEENFSVLRHELCRPEERVSARAQVDMPYSTITGNGNQTIQGSKIDGARITIGQQNGNRALDVSDRERMLILKMRKYASPAMWERLEADLAAAEERYG